jgi:hypothetical protein
MNRVALMNAGDRRALWVEGSYRLRLLPVVLEKDFWVCWMLGLLFGHATWRRNLVFKGGTALSKVFGVIRRFSEDIDLSVSPSMLGVSESEMTNASSRRQRDRWLESLETTCSQWVRECLQPGLEHQICETLGPCPVASGWLEFERDPATHSPVLYFHYPTALDSGAAYIRRSVKLELGALTDQEPVGLHRVHPWIAGLLPRSTGEAGCEVVALGAERTFWEKATILHAEHHRDQASPMPNRYSRHYADVAAMANGPEAERALADEALRERVVDWKSRFFVRNWARYELAKPGTFRLVPPTHRESELARDYHEMQDMFLDTPMPFDVILGTLRRLESRINLVSTLIPLQTTRPAPIEPEISQNTRDNGPTAAPLS